MMIERRFITNIDGIHTYIHTYIQAYIASDAILKTGIWGDLIAAGSDEIANLQFWRPYGR